MKNQQPTQSETGKLEEELASLDELIGRLSLRASTVRKLLSDNKTTNSQHTVAKSNSAKPNQIQIGSRVIVRSRYKGRYGTIGKIDKISGIYGWVRTEANTKRVIQVQLSNLEIYDD